MESAASDHGRAEESDYFGIGPFENVDDARTLVVSAAAAYRNRLAKKVGVISNKIEAEQERHAVVLAKLVEQLDHIYAQLGAEMGRSEFRISLRKEAVMPTGYTAPVQDGDITELADYALTCARGFGAMVTLRDSDQSLEATRRYVEEQSYAQESSYYADALRKSRARLAELRSMTVEQALAAAQAAHDEVVASNERSERKRITELARYEAMIEKVEAWEPPTEDHVEFKKFMLDQLRESVKFDCREFSMPAPEVSLAWRDEEIERELRNVQRYEEEIEKESERNAARIGWVAALLDSLEGVPA